MNLPLHPIRETLSLSQAWMRSFCCDVPEMDQKLKIAHSIFLELAIIE
jgi:hypothetical protein